MFVTHDNDVFRIAAETFTLTCAPDRPFVYLDDAQGQRIAELFIPSSVHTTQGQDDTTQIGSWEIAEAEDSVVASLSASSSVWAHKIYRLRCEPRRWAYEIEVQGAGRLADVNYFGGYYSGHVRWGSGFFWSGQRFKRGFNPEPNTDEVYHFSPAEGSTIDLMGVPLPGKAGWFFTPPPFCFGFETPSGWLGVGVEAAPGQNRFTEYRYHGQRSAFYLSLSFEGHTAVNGRYTLPAISFDPAGDEYGALAAHVRSLARNRLIPAAGMPPSPKNRPGWWREPIFCGWGAQCYVAAIRGGRGPDYACQDLYDEFLGALGRNGVQPGIVVLDDKWQATYGENRVDERKWSDLRGFIARQHAAGRRVLLWLKAWDAEGLPPDECITNAAGRPIALDPTNPAFERRLRASVQRMLSPEGYDADGFKIDFTARIPSGPGLSLQGDAWGLELMRAYLCILHDEAKKAKPDALIMTHTPHPYLSDMVDVLRLNDVNTGQPVIPAMTHRACVAALACPDAIIDTDNWPMKDKAAWREYLHTQSYLGVPSLYYATHIDSTREALDADDYRLVREAWARYRQEIS